MGMRLVLVAGALGFLLTLLTAGCTHVSAVERKPDLVITVKPWITPVKLVSHRPPRDRYVFVGRVRGVALDGEFVDAASHAREKLDARARALGASVIKIDRVATSGSRVVLAGRAYRSIN
jgi:hypothetical protein